MTNSVDRSMSCYSPLNILCSFFVETCSSPDSVCLCIVPLPCFFFMLLDYINNNILGWFGKTTDFDKQTVTRSTESEFGIHVANSQGNWIVWVNSACCSTPVMYRSWACMLLSLAGSNKQSIKSYCGFLFHITRTPFWKEDRRDWKAVPMRMPASPPPPSFIGPAALCRESILNTTWKNNQEMLTYISFWEKFGWALKFGNFEFWAGIHTSTLLTSNTLVVKGMLKCWQRFLSQSLAQE